jgi:uncharacterized membrane protein YfcA
MGSIGEETRRGLLVLLTWVFGWGVGAFVVALLAPSFILALLGMLLLNALGLVLAWRSRAIPGGQDTEWSDAHDVPPPTSPAPHRRQFTYVPPTRPLDLTAHPPLPGSDGPIATARQTYIYDN